MDEGLRSRTGRARPRRVLAAVAAVVALMLLATACINNGAWAAAPAPVTPVQALPTAMNDVSCVTEDWCLAVGWMNFYPLAEVWDGSAWSVVPAPPLGYADNARALSVDCGTTTSCVVKVERSYPSADLYDYAVAWDGSQWHELTGGSEGAYADTTPYSCAPDGSCLVVDNAWEKTVVWDGDSATTIPFTTTRPPSEINAISCLAADLCVAATSYTTALWDGAEWSQLPGGDYYDLFGPGAESISCSAIDHCLAVGRNLFETGPASATWDGSSWTEVALPADVTSASSLDCVSADQCLARALVGGSGAMIAWMGGAWHAAPAPPPGTAGSSCLPRWCLAVGSTGSPAMPTAATYQWSDA